MKLMKAVIEVIVDEKFAGIVADKLTRCKAVQHKGAITSITGLRSLTKVEEKQYLNWPKNLQVK